MIPSLQEISRALFGAWRLLHFDRHGLNYFDVSLQGFWQSFFAAVIVAPGYAILVMIHLGENPPGDHPVHHFLIEALAYTIIWLAFPVIAHWILETIGKADAFIILIIALNWAAVIELLIFLPIQAVSGSGAIPQSFGAALVLGTMLFLVVYEWFIARSALRINGMEAAGFIGCKLIIELMIGQATASMS